MARKPADKAYEVTCRACGAVTRYTTKRPAPTRWCPSCGSSKVDETEIPYGSAPGAGQPIDPPREAD